MQNFKSHFWYNKRQRNGILFLVLFIIILQGIYFYINSSSSNSNNSDVSEIESYQHQIDSLKKLQSKQQRKIFPFNPNYITDFKGYQLGLNVEEIDKLFTFRKTGKFVNSAKEFQNVTGVNDSLLLAISPYFKFPEWTKKKASKKDTYQPGKKVIKTENKIIEHDINTVTVDQLIIIHGIGSKLAKRIIAYRTLLHGFTFNDQLNEVYYLDKETANRILKNYWVTQKPVIQKINLNEATFKEVLHTPYLNYELTKKIFNYRDETGKIMRLEELKKIDSFPTDKFKRIALYLTVD